MIVQGDKALTRLANKQFEILGMKIKFSDIPDNGVVTYKDGKKEKKDYWYNVYKFTEEQEKQWRDWALAELRKICSEEEVTRSVFRELELLYGFSIRYIKKGELF